jgi:hypothetical protein
MAVPPRAAEDLGRLLVRVAAPPRAAEGLGRLPVRVVVPPLGAADRGRRAVPTAAAPTEAPPITAPLTPAARLIFMALPPPELLQALLSAQLQPRLIRVPAALLPATLRLLPLSSLPIIDAPRN